MATLTASAAPASAAQFRRQVKAGILSREPEAKVTFVGRVRRFGPKSWQPQGTVSFLVEVHIDGKPFIGSSFRDGEVDGRVGKGHVSVYPKGCLSVWGKGVTA